MKRNLFLILLVVIIAGAILLTSRHSPFGKQSISFLAAPKDEISKIVFSDGKRELTLENTDGKWLLNGKLETRKSSVNFITDVLKRLSIKSPVSPELFDSAVVQKGITPVRVKSYENRKLLSDFLVYKTRSNIYGNIMKTRERTKPFIVYVPGYDGDIGSAFTMNELYWQPYTIFNLLPSEIISVRFENNLDTTASFSIIRSGKEFILMAEDTPVPEQDSTLVKRYLTYYMFIPFEMWALDLSEEATKSITGSTPAYVISVNSADGMEVELTLWTRENPDGTLDSDRMYGQTNVSDEIFIVRYFDIDPLLKRRDYFLR